MTTVNAQQSDRSRPPWWDDGHFRCGDDVLSVADPDYPVIVSADNYAKLWDGEIYLPVLAGSYEVRHRSHCGPCTSDTAALLTFSAAHADAVQLLDRVAAVTQERREMWTCEGALDWGHLVAGTDALSARDGADVAWTDVENECDRAHGDAQFPCVLVEATAQGDGTLRLTPVFMQSANDRPRQPR